VLLGPAVVYWPRTAPDGVSWISAILLGVFCTGIAYVLYFRLLARVGPSRTLTVTYLIPVFGVVWGYAFIGEVITRRMALAGAVIFVGVALATGAFKRSLASQPVVETLTRS